MAADSSKNRQGSRLLFDSIFMSVSRQANEAVVSRCAEGMSLRRSTLRSAHDQQHLYKCLAGFSLTSLHVDGVSQTGERSSWRKTKW